MVLDLTQITRIKRIAMQVRIFKDFVQLLRGNFCGSERRRRSP